MWGAKLQAFSSTASRSGRHCLEKRASGSYWIKRWAGLVGTFQECKLSHLVRSLLAVLSGSHSVMDVFSFLFLLLAQEIQEFKRLSF
jgi:hypothetical protein